jgi:hypothetical protein
MSAFARSRATVILDRGVPSNFRTRTSDVLCFLKADLRVDNLRSERGFQDLLRRMNFPR